MLYFILYQTHQVPTRQNAILHNAHYFNGTKKPGEGQYQITLLQFYAPRVSTCHGCSPKNRFLYQHVQFLLGNRHKVETNLQRGGQEGVGKL